MLGWGLYPNFDSLKLLAIQAVESPEIGISWFGFNASRIASNVDSTVTEQKDPTRPIRTQKPLRLQRKSRI